MTKLVKLDSGFSGDSSCNLSAEGLVVGYGGGEWQAGVLLKEAVRGFG